VEDREQGKWVFGLLWVAANTLGWGTLIIVSMAAGWLVWVTYDNSSWGPTYRLLSSELVRTLIALVTAGLCWGAIIGVLQQFILRRRIELEGMKWVLATSIGLTVYTAVQTLVPALAAGSLPFRLYQMLSGVCKFAAPFAFGTTQWFLLRRYMTRAGWWVAAVAVASWLSYFVRLTLTTGLLRTSVFVGMYVAEGAIYSAATLVALAIMRRRPTAAVEQVVVEDE
jgi:hypothetical protein